MELIKEDITIPAGEGVHLEGELILPDDAFGLVIFAHGSGSNRHSTRNNHVAAELQRRGLGTLLFDMLTVEEDMVQENRYNIDMLTERLVGVTRWVSQLNEVRNLPIGFFGSSRGSASALRAAGRLGEQIKAVVSRGGRPELALAALPNVQAATLLLVGGLDYTVLQYNEQAMDRLSCTKELEVIPKAGHLFEEPGKLEEVTQLAADWYQQHLK